MSGAAKKGSNSRFCLCRGIYVYPKKSKTRKIDAKKSPSQKRGLCGKKYVDKSRYFSLGVSPLLGRPLRDPHAADRESKIMHRARGENNKHKSPRYYDFIIFGKRIKFYVI